MYKNNQKIILLNPAVSPYRVGFYDEISKNSNIKFLFYFHDAPDEDTYPEMKNWDYEILKGEIGMPGYARGFNLELVDKLLNEDYDIIVNSDPCSFAAHVAFPIAKLRRKKFITWAELWSYPNTAAARLIKPYVKAIIRKSDACIAAGTKAKELLTSFGAKNVEIAPNSSFDVRSLKKGYIPLPKRYIFCVTQEHASSGIHILKSAADKLNIPLIVIGQDKRVDWKELRPYYENCTVYVQPTIRISGVDPVASWEMGLNEAMSASKPVIATDIVGGAYDLIIQGKNGLIVENNNEEALFNAMSLILKGNIESMGEQSRKIIDERFNHKNMAKCFISLLETL